MSRLPERFEHEGIEGLRAGRYDIGINSSCILYRVGSTLVDTGPPNQWRAVRRFLQERKVRHVLVTHHHEDHSGNAARIHRVWQSEVFVPENGREPVSRGFRLRPYQRIIWGVPDRFEASATPARTVLKDGRVLEAIATPGHSPDMTCFLERQRGWLFTGDLYIASKPRFLRADESVSEQIGSLRKVLDLDFGTVLCAHRGVVREGSTAIRAKLGYLESLRDEVRHLRDEGRSIREITRTLLGRESTISMLTMYHFSKRNLVRGCLEIERNLE